MIRRRVTLPEALQREAAQAIERAVNAMQDDAALSNRWWRPSWDAGYRAALADVHAEVAAMLDAYGIWHPGGAS